MAFLAPALPAIGGAVASWGLNQLSKSGKKDKTGKSGEYLWETTQSPEERAAYNKILSAFQDKAFSEKWGEIPKFAPVPGQAHLAMNVIGGGSLGRQFAPMNMGMITGGGMGSPFARAGTAPPGGGMPPQRMPLRPGPAKPGYGGNPWMV